LIPVSHTGHIILSFKHPSIAYPYLLYGHLQILVKTYRILDMPAVKAPHRHTVVIMIRIMYPFIITGVKRISHIRGTIVLLHCFPVYLFCKAPGTSEIIFRSCAADGRILLISVYIKFDFSLSPPITFQGGQSHISSYIMAFPFYLIQDHIIPAKLRDPLPPPLGVEISNVFREGFLIQAVIDLVKESRDLIGMLVFQADLCLL